MIKLHSNIIFFISTSGHYDILDVYKTTIRHYKAKLGGSLDAFVQSFAHVKVKPSQRDRLPDIIDFLLDEGIKPIVTEGEWARGLSHGNAYLSDIFKVFNTEQVHAEPYSFWVEDDSPIHVHQGDLFGYLQAAVNVLATNKDVLNVRFQRDGVSNVTKPINDLFNAVDTFDFQPNMGRTRDLFLAAKLIRDNHKAFEHTQCEAAFRMASDTLSYSPYRYVCFNPKLVTSHHIGAPDYHEIIKRPEFASL